MRRLLLMLSVVLIIGTIVGCVPPGGRKARSGGDETFHVTMSPSWASIEWKEGLDYDKAWRNVFEVIARKFPLRTIDKENGYLQTDWASCYSGSCTENYQTRVTVIFHRDSKKLDFRSEAQIYNPGIGWSIGTDTKLSEDMKTLIMGTIGRTAR
ncbi:MAG: hypothetical protein M0042_11775 [Nitrospiraceae bacterium]|nr:hypothetical protein [Nitrospiraceae bacterium]